MKIFLDTDIVLNHMQESERMGRFLTFIKESTDNRIYVSCLTMADVACILRGQYTGAELNILFRSFISECNVLPMTEMQLYDALRCSNPSPDFRDGLQVMCAESGGCDVIITHNVDHYRPYTDIPAITPEDFISHCQK